MEGPGSDFFGRSSPTPNLTSILGIPFGPSAPKWKLSPTQFSRLGFIPSIITTSSGYSMFLEVDLPEGSFCEKFIACQTSSFRVKSRVDTDCTSAPRGIIIIPILLLLFHVVRIKFHNLFVLDKHPMPRLFIFTLMLSRYVRCIPTEIKITDLFPPTIQPLIFPTGFFNRLLIARNRNRNDESSKYKENQGVQE